MEQVRRLYLVGAGASKQDGLPLTSELKYGIAWAIGRDGQRFAPLLAHLRHLYNVDDAAIAEGQHWWDRICSCELPAMERGNISAPTPRTTAGLPDITEWLSTIDWMIREQTSFGPDSRTSTATALSLLSQLTEVRDLVVQGLCVSLHEYKMRRPRSPVETTVTDLFMRLVGGSDVIVTTNWDLLLDAARDARFGTSDGDYGALASNVVLENVTTEKATPRPKLLKLHGSLSWRYCPRCQRLVINPNSHVAGERRRPSASCECSFPFSELIVTPGFVREYRNVHLLSIWHQALLAFAFAEEWVSIGYSLPPDDVGIRALLFRARCIRQDLERAGKAEPLKVTVVSGDRDREAVHARFCSIAPAAECWPENFFDYVTKNLVAN